MAAILPDPPFLIPTPINAFGVIDTATALNQIARQLNVLTKASIITATVYQSAATLVNGSTLTPIAFSSFFDETLQAVDLADFPTRIITPAGMRLVRLNGYASWNKPSTQTYRALYIVKNGNTASPIAQITGPGVNSQNIGQSLTTSWLPASTGDYFELYAWQADAVPTGINGDTGFGTGPKLSAEFKP